MGEDLAVDVVGPCLVCAIGMIGAGAAFGGGIQNVASDAAIDVDGSDVADAVAVIGGLGTAGCGNRDHAPYCATGHSCGASDGVLHGLDEAIGIIGKISGGTIGVDGTHEEAIAKFEAVDFAIGGNEFGNVAVFPTNAVEELIGGFFILIDDEADNRVQIVAVAHFLGSFINAWIIGGFDDGHDVAVLPFVGVGGSSEIVVVGGGELSPLKDA